MVEKGRKKGTVRFSLAPAGGASKVELVGSFTDWLGVPMRKQKNGSYVAIVPVVPGTYEYKFIVDGDWVVDPDNSAWVMNPFGTFNSVLHAE